MNLIASAPLQRRTGPGFSPRFLLPALVLLTAGLGSVPAFAQATHFKFLVPPSSAAGLYTTSVGSNAITVEVQALDSSNALVTGFNHSVVAGLYSTATSQLSDPLAVYENAATTFIGSMPMSWVNGTAGFSVTFEAGSDSEQIVLQDQSGSPVVAGTTYPGSLGVTTGAAMTVRGFLSQPLFPRNFHFNGTSENPPTDDTPFVYTSGGSTDNLATTDNTVTFFGPGDYGDIVPKAGGTAGGSGIDTKAACYLIQNFSGGYAAGGAGVSVRLWFSTSAGTAPVSYQVILDYDGSLTDYNNPDSTKDTVLQGVVTCGVGYGFFTAAPTTLAGYKSYQPFMLSNAQAIFRVWTAAGKSVTMKYANANVFPTDDNSISFIKIPYSSQNIQPLRSTVTSPSYTGTPPSPPFVLAGFSPTTLIDTLTNQYSSGLTQVIFQIPADPLGTTNWVISSVPPPTGPNPGSSTGVLQASGTTSGAVTVNFNPSNPLTPNEIVPVTIIGQSPATNYSWPMSLLGATSNTGSNAPVNSASVTVFTLEAPDKPGSFSALPANFAGTGGQISLSWSQSVSQSPLGYVLSRSPGAASGNPFGDPITLPSGLVVSNAITLLPSTTTSYLDSTVTNLTGYTYSIQSFNNVTQSAVASTGPVSAFADPNPPGSVSALTGGSNVQLSWAAPASAAGSYAVTGYQIYRGTSPGAENTTPIAQVGLVTSYNDPGLATGPNYYYYLSSMDNQYSGGPTLGPHDSGPSAETTGFPPGNPPNNVGVTLAVIGPPATLAVTWTAPTNDLNAITNYYIWKETDSGPFAALVTVGSAAVSVWDGLVTTGHTYSYFVQAVDSLNNVSNNSATVTGQVGPSPPTGLLPTGYASSVTMTWNSNPPAENVVSYVIKSNGVPITVVPAPASGTVTGFDSTVFDAVLIEGNNYGYQVAGINNTGVTGTYCTAVTSSLLPLTPQSFVANLTQPVTQFNINLSWSAPVSGGNVTNYNIRSGTSAGNISTAVTLGLVATSYQVVEPTTSAGTTFFFLVRAQDPGGVSSVAATVGLQVPPNPPTGLSSNSTAATITLNWSANASQENVSHYTVYRSTSPTSGFTNIGTSTTASYADGLVAADTDYYYKVTATNPGGGAVTIPGGESLFSASVTAALAPPVPAGLNATLNPANDNVVLGWTSQTGSDPILQTYTLYRTKNGGAPTTLQTAAGTVVAYTDTGVTSADAGTTVFYYLFATNNAGANSVPEGPIGLQVPPNPPAILPASPSSAAVTVNWTANPTQENVSQYTIYRSALPAGAPSAVGTATPGTATSFADLGPLSQGVTYAYYVTATNPGGGVGVPGGTSSASSTVNSGLGAPVPSGPGIASIDTSNNIGVTWTNVTLTVPNATAVSLIGGPTSIIGSASATNLAATAVTFYDNGVFSASVTGEQPDTTYYYWLETLNTFGPSSASLPASQLTYPAAVSLGTVVLNSNGSRSVSWATVGNGDVTSYNIYREQIGGSGFVSVGSVPAAGLNLPVTLSNPTLPGKQYGYKVTAVNGTGEGTFQNVVTIGVPPSDPLPVTAVSGLSTVPEVGLSWPANAAGEGVTGYSVYRGTTPNWSAATSIAGGAVTTYLDNTGLTGGTTYYYWVEAQDGDGVFSLPTSLTSSVTIAAAAQPNAPTGLSETDGNASANLTWSAAVSTTFPIAGYNLYDSPNGGATVKANATPVAAPPSVVSGLTNGVSYNLWVQAVDSHGNLSPLSTPVLGLPDSPPGIPGSVSGSSGNNETQVTWSPSVAGTLPIGSYLVEKIAAGVTTTASVPGNQTGYVDSLAVNGNAYTYLVEAVDSTGVTTGSHVSGYSSAVTVTAGLITVNPPSQLTALGGVNLVKLSWVDPSTGSPVTGYQVFRAETAPSVTPYTLLTSTATGTSPLSDAVTNGNTYGYYMVAYSSGVPSASSATIFATAAAPPAAPSPVSLLDGGQENLSWGASPSQGAVTISSYYIVSSVNGGTAATIASTSGSVTTYTDSSPSIGQTVVYQVGAVNSNGTTGVLSTAQTGYTYAPMTITGLTSTDSISTVTLNWVGPGTITWGPVQFNILRTTLTGGSPTTILNATSPYVDPGTLGQLYLYTVTAVDAKNHASVGGGPVTDGPLNPPAAPATVVATAGNQQILFDWAPSAPVSDSLPVSYYLLSLNGGAPVSLPATVTSYLDSSLINGTGVTAVVQAVDATGNPVGNHISAAVTGGPVTTSGTLLNPPTGAAVTAASGSTNVLTWTRPNDEGFIVTGYNIYRSNSFTTVLGSPIATLPNPALNPVTVFMDNGVSANTTYYYVITANYQQGSSIVASPPSNHAWDTTPAPQAGVPPVTPGQMAFDANLLKPLTGQVLNIYFIAPNDGPAEIDVYNVSGNPIRALFAAAAAGKQESLAWDGKDRNGNTVASGIYLVEIKGPGIHLVRKVLVVK